MIKGVSIANLGRGGEGVDTHGWEGWAPGVHEGHGNMTGARQRNENDMKGHELGTTIMRDDHGREHREWDEEESGGPLWKGMYGEYARWSYEGFVHEVVVEVWRVRLYGAWWRRF